MNDLDRLKSLAGISSKPTKLNENYDISMDTDANEVPQHDPEPADSTVGAGLSDWVRREAYSKLKSELDRTSFPDAAVQNTVDSMYSSHSVYASEVDELKEYLHDLVNDLLSDDDLAESAPPGMEDLVKKLKKEYPGEEEKAYATAWSIYNKTQGVDETIKKDGSQYQLLSKSGKNLGKYPTKAGAEERERQVNYFKHMNECYTEDEQLNSAIDEILQSSSASFVSKDDALVKVYHFLAGLGIEPTDINDIMHNVENYVNSSGSDAKDEEIIDDLSHTEDEVDEGRVVDLDPRVAKSLAARLDKERWERHAKNNPPSTDVKDSGEAHITWRDLAKDLEKVRAGTEEITAEDLNNGYDDIEYSSGCDYFPDGATSPVISKVGPSGARHGDNPEQKKMAISEDREITDQEVKQAYRNAMQAELIMSPDRYALADYARSLAMQYEQQKSMKAHGRRFDPITGDLLPSDSVNNTYNELKESYKRFIAEQSGKPFEITKIEFFDEIQPKGSRLEFNGTIQVHGNLSNGMHVSFPLALEAHADMDVNKADKPVGYDYGSDVTRFNEVPFYSVSSVVIDRASFDHTSDFTLDDQLVDYAEFEEVVRPIAGNVLDKAAIESAMLNEFEDAASDAYPED